ncbi:unnamed protein product, partial [Arctia plantaginis]
VPRISPSQQVHPINNPLQPPKDNDHLLAEVISTQEIQGWIASIEALLQEVCTVVADGKMNPDQRFRVTNIKHRDQRRHRETPQL